MATASSDCEQMIRALPCWRGAIRIAALDGGMTNRNFRIDDAGLTYAVRLGRDLPEHGIVRWHELAAARAAHAAGLSPQVVYAAPGVMVSHFIVGRTLGAEDVRAPARRDALVRLLRTCHHTLALHLHGPVLMFWVFQVIRNYLALLREQPGALTGQQLDEWSRLSDDLARAVGPVDIVFGHNDLLAANLIDDGHRLWLIDWDYAGFNSPLFDLANLSANNGFDTDQDRDLLACYFEMAPDAARWRAFVAMRCASVLRETLWGQVSHRSAQIDFDFAAYARQWQDTLQGTIDAFRACAAPH